MIELNNIETCPVHNDKWNYYTQHREVRNGMWQPSACYLRAIMAWIHLTGDMHAYPALPSRPASAESFMKSANKTFLVRILNNIFC